MAVKTSVHPYVTQLENRLRPVGLKIKPAKLDEVLRFVNWDVDLAFTAFTMMPQASWVTEMVGPRELQER